MEEPDFESYSLEELKQVYHRIDRVRFPDRFLKIEAILNNPEKVAKLESNPLSGDDLPPLSELIKRKFIHWCTEYSFKECMYTTAIFLVWLAYTVLSGQFATKTGYISVSDSPAMYWIATVGLALFCLKFLILSGYKLYISRQNSDDNA